MRMRTGLVILTASVLWASAAAAPGVRSAWRTDSEVARSASSSASRDEAPKRQWRRAA